MVYTSPLLLLLVTAFIRDNPGMTAVAFATVFSAMCAMAWGWLTQTNANLRKLAARVAELEILLGHSSFAALLQSVNELRVENTKEHGSITSEIVAVKGRVKALEDNPNERLDEALDILHTLLKKA